MIRLIAIFFSLVISTVFGCIPTESPIDEIIATTTALETTTPTTTTSTESPTTTTTTPTTTTTSTSTSTTSTTTTSTTSTTTSTTTTTTPAPMCLPDWTYFATTGFCYYLAANLNTNHDQAQSYCVDTWGATLGSIHSNAENDFVAGLAPEENAVIALGVRRNGGCDGCFFNVDGTPYNYNRWSGGQPDNANFFNEYCVDMLLAFTVFPCCFVPNGFRGQWNDIPCNTVSKYVLCKMPQL